MDADIILSQLMNGYDFVHECEELYQSAKNGMPDFESMKKEAENSNKYFPLGIFSYDGSANHIDEEDEDGELIPFTDTTVKVKISAHISVKVPEYNQRVHDMKMKGMKKQDGEKEVPNYKQENFVIIESAFFRAILDHPKMKKSTRFHFYKAGTGLMDWHFDYPGLRNSAEQSIKCSERAVLKNISV